MFDAAVMADDTTDLDARILTAARSELSRPGIWHQGNYDFSGNQACPVQALFRAISAEVGISHRDHMVTYWRLRDRLVSRLPAGFLTIPLYNDAPTTTLADVLALFE